MRTQSSALTSAVRQALAELLEAVRATDTCATLPDYIPELALADPELLGIALTTVSGRTYQAEAASSAFTIQSISKPFVYALALQALGPEQVAKHVGVEPSGDAFNAISFDARGRPANPMVNLGAIVATSLLGGGDADERFELIQSGLSAFAGRPLEVDERVYRSESATGDRNRGLAALARSTGVLASGIDAAVEPYFKQCALLVDCTDLSLMAATLAHHGVNPVTGVRVVDAVVARHTLSVMASCGMYDRSGQWLVEVGLAAKSGVGGGIIAVTPGLVGIGVFSPPLDEVGNSARGVQALRRLSTEAGLHMFNHPQQPSSPIGQITTEGQRLTMIIRGNVDFVAAELILAQGASAIAQTQARLLVLDFTAATGITVVAQTVLKNLLAADHPAGLVITTADPGGLLTTTDSADRAGA